MGAAGGGARRKAQVTEADRVFSRSSAGFMRVRSFSVELNGAGLIGIGISDAFVCADDAGAYAVVKWG